MIKGKGREKLLWALTIGLGVLFASDRLLFSGLRTKSQTLHRKIAEEEVKLRMGVGIQKRKDTILNEQKKYALYLPPPAQERELIARFLKETERIAQESGVTIADLTPDNQPAKGMEYKIYKAQLKAESTMEQLLSFLYKLQTSRLPIKLDRFSIAPKDEQATTLRLETTISMAVP